MNLELNYQKTKVSPQTCVSASNKPTGSISATTEPHLKSIDEKKNGHSTRQSVGRGTFCAKTASEVHQLKSKQEANDVPAQGQNQSLEVNENDKKGKYLKNEDGRITERTEGKTGDDWSLLVRSEMFEDEGRDGGAEPERSQTSLKEDLHFSEISEDEGEVCSEEHSGMKVDVSVRKPDVVTESQGFIADEDTPLVEKEASSSKQSQAFNCSDESAVEKSSGKIQPDEQTSRIGEDSETLTGEREDGPFRKFCRTSTDDSFNKDQAVEGQTDVVLKGFAEPEVCEMLDSVEGTRRDECQKLKVFSGLSSKENTRNAEETNVHQVKGPMEDQTSAELKMDGSMDQSGQDEMRRQPSRDPQEDTEKMTTMEEKYQPITPTKSHTRETNNETTSKVQDVDEMQKNSRVENTTSEDFTASMKDDLTRKLNEEEGPYSPDSMNRSLRTTPGVPVNSEVLINRTVHSLRDDQVQDKVTSKREVMLRKKNPEKRYFSKPPVKRKIRLKEEELKKKVSRFSGIESQDRKERKRWLVGTSQEIPEEVDGEEVGRGGTADGGRNDGKVDLQKLIPRNKIFEEKENHEEMLKVLDKKLSDEGLL